jgi:methyl-accepting chemotaxis protein
VKFLKTGISKRFVIIISVIFATLILSLSLTFNFLLNENYSLLERVLMRNQEDVLIEKAGAIVMSAREGAARGSNGIAARLRQQMSEDRSLMGAIIFSQTADENYFRVVEVVPADSSFDPGLKRGDVVRENRSINYLRQAVARATVDPVIQTDKGLYWYNVYTPLQASARQRSGGPVVQLIVSASQTMTTLNEYSGLVRTMKRYIIITNVAAVLVVIFVLLHFMQNFTFLIKSLSKTMKKASQGEFVSGMNGAMDDELAELAESFNSLIDEMKELREKERQMSLEARYSLNDIFKSGVQNLKENRLDDAVALFRTLLLFNPESFGDISI